MDIGMLFLAAVGLPEKNWGENLELILFVSIAAVILVKSAVSIVCDYRRNRFCTFCHSKTVLGWRTEKREKFARFGRTAFYRDRIIVVLRCP